MKKMALAATSVLAIGFGLSSVAVATAEDREETSLAEFQALMKASISVVEAAAAVEGQSGAKVIDVSLSDENGVVAYQVTAVTADGAVMDFQVDPMTGAVTALPANHSIEGGENGESGGERENRGENGI